MTTVFTTLKPYLKQAVAQNADTGLPVMRPLFLHYENDAATYTLKYQYLLGQDLLVAPVHEQGALRLDAVPAGRSLGEYLDR